MIEPESMVVSELTTNHQPEAMMKLDRSRRQLQRKTDVDDVNNSTNRDISCTCRDDDDEEEADQDNVIFGYRRWSSSSDYSDSIPTKPSCIDRLNSPNFPKTNIGFQRFQASPMVLEEKTFPPLSVVQVAVLSSSTTNHRSIGAHSSTVGGCIRKGTTESRLDLDNEKNEK